MQHTVADRLLQAVTLKLTSFCRLSDLIAFMWTAIAYVDMFSLCPVLSGLCAQMMDMLLLSVVKPRTLALYSGIHAGACGPEKEYKADGLRSHLFLGSGQLLAVSLC